MIKTYRQIYSIIEKKAARPIAIVQPRHKLLLSAIDQAAQKGWIDPILFHHNDDAVAARQAVAAVKNDDAELIMKGDLDSATLLKAVLENDGLRTNRRLSHVAVVESPYYERLMLWSDGGVNIQLNQEIMESIIANARVVSNVLGISHPNIALLALVENVNKKLPETVLAYELTKKYSHHSDFSIEGPIALDVALSKEAALRKDLSSTIAGKTDIFIGPSITVTNHVVKSLINIGGAKGGGIIIGAQIPIVMLSRSDSTETKLNSIALGLLASTGD